MVALKVYACLANDAAPWQRHSEGVGLGFAFEVLANRKQDFKTYNNATLLLANKQLLSSFNVAGAAAAARSTGKAGAEQGGAREAGGCYSHIELCSEVPLPNPKARSQSCVGHCCSLKSKPDSAWAPPRPVAKGYSKSREMQCGQASAKTAQKERMIQKLGLFMNATLSPGSVCFLPRKEMSGRSSEIGSEAFTVERLEG